MNGQSLNLAIIHALAKLIEEKAVPAPDGHYLWDVERQCWLDHNGKPYYSDESNETLP